MEAGSKLMRNSMTWQEHQRYRHMSPKVKRARSLRVILSYRKLSTSKRVSMLSSPVSSKWLILRAWVSTLTFTITLQRKCSYSNKSCTTIALTVPYFLCRFQATRLLLLSALIPSTSKARFKTHWRCQANLRSNNKPRTLISTQLLSRLLSSVSWVPQSRRSLL